MPGTAVALAPIAGAALAAPLGGYPHMFALLAVISFVAALGALGTRTAAAPGTARQPAPEITD